MALNRNSTYGQRWAETSDDSPQGAYKNKSDPTDTQASYLEANVLNDSFSGLQGAFLANKHAGGDGTGAPTGYVDPTDPAAPTRFIPSGTQDTAQASQVYNEWYKKTQDIVDAKNAEIQAIVDGCYFQYYNLTSFPSSSDFTNVNLSSIDHTLNNENITLDNNGKIKFLIGGTFFIELMTTSMGDYKFVDASDTSITILHPKGKYFKVPKGNNSGSGVGRQIFISADSGGTYQSGSAFVSTLAISVAKNQEMYLQLNGTSGYIQFNMTRVGKESTVAFQQDIENPNANNPT